MFAFSRQLKQDLESRRAEAIAQFAVDARPEKLLKQLRRDVDHVFTIAWRETGMSGRAAALIAVGGYGRGELFPYSDVDVLILLQQKPDEAMQARLEKLIQHFWDLGLKIGHSVRTLEECLEASAQDITTQTGLLEARLVTGNRELFRSMKKQYDAAMNPQAFFLAKTLETRQRHQKFGNTPYSLEPDCKDGPGGLRDLQMILWLAKASGLGASWYQLAKRQLITPSEAQQLQKKERAFKDIRIRLHIQTRRPEDRLLFDVQIPIAEQFHFKKAGKILTGQSASELMMQRYYLAARTVMQLHRILLQNLQTWLFPQPHTSRKINARFNEVNGLIDIASDEVFQQTPSAMLEVFLLLAQRSELRHMTARTLRMLWHARMRINPAFIADPAHHALFLDILKAPHVSRALQDMNETGVLGRLLPTFGKIVCQMQHDLFHQYTVDQHILKVIAQLHRFTLSEYAHENPFCSQLMVHFGQPWLLYIAALFHDIAKGRGGDHALLGMEDAKQFCQHYGIGAEDTELIVFLVGEHLTLSHFAQKRDISSFDVIREFAARMQNERRLTALFLLTVADIQGTSALNWTAWKARLLEGLYHVTRRVLGGEELSVDNELKKRQEDALAMLRFHGILNDSHMALWKQLDIVYFLRHDAADIAWQTRVLLDHLETDEPVVRCRLSPVGEGLQVTVYTQDQPDLFMRICSYFGRRKFSIIDAKIHTTKHGYALDTFWVTLPAMEQTYRDVISLVEHNLTAWLKSDHALEALPKTPLSRKSRIYPITPSVELRPDASGKLFILSVTATDRPGLLYDIACVLSQYRINLHTAKIMTLGERAEDVFLVAGESLHHPPTQIQFETALLAALRI